MSVKIDARGLSCPQPVVLVKKAIDRLGKGEEIEVRVDTVASKENVSRLARNSGFQITEQEEKGEFILRLAKD